MKKKRFVIIGIATGMVLALASCVTISPFNAQAYQMATELKVRSALLMENSDEEFSEYADQVAALRQDALIALEHSRGRDKNEITTRQWEVLLDRERNLLGGFLVFWEEQGSVSPAFAEEATRLVSEAFDTIITLESKKIRPGEAMVVE